MTKVITNNKYYSEIANAIRERLNTSEKYYPSEMASAINQIVKVPNLSNIRIRTNGEHFPTEGYDGFYEVQVTIPSHMAKKTFTEPGVFLASDENFRGYYSVKINLSTDDEVVVRTAVSYINNNIDYVRPKAFAYCSDLEEIQLDNCRKIDNYAFTSCINLSYIEFSSCSVIEDYAFYQCYNLQSISLPNCEVIGSYAFNNYYRYDPSWNYKSIYKSSYFSHIKLSNVYLPKCKIIYDSAFTYQPIIELNLPECTTIKDYAFTGCQSLTKITLNNCFTLNNKEGFGYCYNLTEINLLNCQSIIGSPFINCTNLQNIDFPNCKYISENVFEFCTLLKSVKLNNCVELYSSVFSNCTNLEYINLPECNIISGSFYDNNSSIFQHAYNTFYNCYALKEIYLPKCETIICGFNDCSQLQIISAPECKFLGYGGIVNCSNLNEAYLNNCRTIGSFAFYNCKNLSILYFSNCEIISKYAFKSCEKLEKLILTNNFITTLDDVTVFDNTPMRVSTYLNHYGSIYVPESLVYNYRIAPKWAQIQDIIAGYETIFNTPTLIEVDQLPNKLFYATEDEEINVDGLITKAYIQTFNSRELFTDLPEGIINNSELNFKLKFNNNNNNIYFIDSPQFITSYKNYSYRYDSNEPVIYFLVRVIYNTTTDYFLFFISKNHVSVRVNDGTYTQTNNWLDTTYSYNGITYYILSPRTNNINLEEHPFDELLTINNKLNSNLTSDTFIWYKEIFDVVSNYINIEETLNSRKISNNSSCIMISWYRPVDNYLLTTNYIIDTPSDLDIKIIQLPSKLNYNINEELDFSDLQVEAYFKISERKLNYNNIINGLIPVTELNFELEPISENAIIFNSGIISANNGNRSPITKVNNEKSICFIVTNVFGNVYGGNWIGVFSIGLTDDAAKLTCPNSITSQVITIDNITYYIYYSTSNKNWGGATTFTNPFDVPVYEGPVATVNQTLSETQVRNLLKISNFEQLMNGIGTRNVNIKWNNPYNNKIIETQFEINFN